MIEPKIKPCKGTGKAKGYGCSEPTLIRKYGLCRECLYKFYRENPKQIKPIKQQRKPKQPKTASKKIDKALDIAWSRAVKIRDGNRCVVCGSFQNLNSHHIYSRAKKSVRWDIDNGVTLCVGHHIGNCWSAHKSPIDFAFWLQNKKGKKFIDKLRLKAQHQSHLSLFEKEIMLSELNKYIDEQP